MTTIEQSDTEACELFLDWLDRRVTVAGRGDGVSSLAVAPSSTFWLGRLACETDVIMSPYGDRGERLDPCAIGIRVRPQGNGPWRFRVVGRATAWVQAGQSDWRPREPVIVDHVITVDPNQATTVAGSEGFSRAFRAVGADHTAEFRVDAESRRFGTELTIQLVNTTLPGNGPAHLFQTSLEVHYLDRQPFLLESLPDSFRYDRRVEAYGVNVGVEAGPDGVLRTTDNVRVQTRRPTYWSSSDPIPDLRFRSLAQDPVGPLQALVSALSRWNEQAWSVEALTDRKNAEGWSPGMHAEAERSREHALEEQRRLQRGVDLLRTDDTIRRAFMLMNDAIGQTAERRGFDSWRPFQIAFQLGVIVYLRDPSERNFVDTVWFATGGGKTETYLGLLVTAAFFDRLTGKTTGISAWSRFPLRLLSLQQTQRFADALACAEVVRRRENIGGDPFSLGFFVGKANTPNRVREEERSGDPDPDSAGMPDKYQVLLKCPFCGNEQLRMRFDRRYWRLAHQCRRPGCAWPEANLPFYVVDEEIYRFLPTVILGTLDKAALLAFQTGARCLVGAPLGFCTEQGHGHTYAARSDRPGGCLVPGCAAVRIGPLRMAANLYPPTLRLQDELHLLRDSLGAVDSHYESLLDSLQATLTSTRAKIVASSATLAGHDRQAEVIYSRTGRVFPRLGPTSDTSFWTRRSDSSLRKFVAVAPRGVTLDHVVDRTVFELQRAARDLVEQPEDVCRQAGIDPRWSNLLISNYGTDIVYGSTLHEVEGAARSIESNIDLDINAVQLTSNTNFDEVREVLDRLEAPEPAFEDRLQVLAASSMLSHGVDVARLNVMVMMGLPLTTAEFIQTTARVGRTLPGLVYVLHKIARERDATTFRQFHQFVTHGDRFVDPVPVTRRSRRVTKLTIPAFVEARRIAIFEPSSSGRKVTTPALLRSFVDQRGIEPVALAEQIAQDLGFTEDADEALRSEIFDWMRRWHRNLTDPALDIRFTGEIGPTAPMTSLRDVDESAPIVTND